MARDGFTVSALIPAYNERDRIAGAIGAILAQTEPPAEIVVVDDGSTDDTADVAARLGARVVRQANAGPAAARNRAIREARADWIAFCDADDRWLPGMLASVRGAHELRPGVEFIFCDYRLERDGRVLVASDFAVSAEYAAAVSTRLSPEVALCDRTTIAPELARANFITTSGICVRKALLERTETYFDERLAFAGAEMIPEDIEWYLRVLAHADALGVGPACVAHHRRAGSLSAHDGHVKDGLVRLGELIAAAPHRYAPGTGEALAGERRRHLRDAAIGYARELRFAIAARRLGAAQRLGFRPADEALRIALALGAFPGGVVAARALRRAWRSALKPAVRTIARR